MGELFWTGLYLISEIKKEVPNTDNKDGLQACGHESRKPGFPKT